MMFRAACPKASAQRFLRTMDRFPDTWSPTITNLSISGAAASACGWTASLLSMIGLSDQRRPRICIPAVSGRISRSECVPDAREGQRLRAQGGVLPERTGSSCRRKSWPGRRPRIRSFGPTLAWRPGVTDIDSAVAAAKQADVVIAVVGLTREVEGEEMFRPLPSGRLCRRGPHLD